MPAKAVAVDARARTSAIVRALPSVWNSFLAVSMAGWAEEVRMRSRKANTAVRTRSALWRPMTFCSWPRTAAKTSNVGKTVSTAMKAFSPDSPSTRSRSLLRQTSATSRQERRTTPRGRGRAASAAVRVARLAGLRPSA